MDNVRFEWDERKRDLVLAKHGLDFLDAVKMFAGPVLSARSQFAGEER